jgi:hypothetical protein
MLKNTLILPDSDARLAAGLLQDAIDTLDVILMMVFGRSPEATEVVGWADRLCDKTRLESGGTIRRVVWIRSPDSKSVQSVLEGVTLDGPTLPLVAVLNFHDELRGTILVEEEVRPVILERFFLKGGETD